ncbi:beta-CASP ribonuclease aCPSF1, partial [Candidatus Micrarchaeota archaeon]|nr:beta-CASP ribonuclease aCPSF1 [Candidatus Micrarchaeota archaeon]
ASAIHTAYPEYLRKDVQRRILQNDSPFTTELFHTADWKDREAIVQEKGCVILASSGMLTGGASLWYLHRLAEDPMNTLLFVGWQGEGSLGRKLQSGIGEVPVTAEGGRAKRLKIRMRIETLEGFSGHSDRNQLSAYVRDLKPKPKRILVDHGDRIKTVEFAKYISNKFRINCSAPRDLDSVRLR